MIQPTTLPDEYLLNPCPSGMFNRAIAQSGSLLCPWAILNYVGNYTRQLAARMNCPTHNSDQLVQCLRGKDAQQLLQFQRDIQVFSRYIV